MQAEVVKFIAQHLKKHSMAAVKQKRDSDE